MKRKYFIIVPANTPNGPIKGAFALANSLVKTRDVTLVFINEGPGSNANLNSAVKIVYLAKFTFGFFRKLRLYRFMLGQSGSRDQLISISMCFSADFINLFCRSKSITCSSVRGNLIKNYQMEYGVLGIFLAITHLITLRLFDHVIVMSESMAKQVKIYIGKNPKIICNFVDERMLNHFRKYDRKNRNFRFLFLGSLTNRKRPLILLKALKALRISGVDVYLDIVGDGPLRADIQYYINEYSLSNYVRVHGFQKNPLKWINSADAMVLPSASEGTSRSVLEALYIGVPCVLAEVDGNSELIVEGYNGALFSSEDELPEAMIRAINLSKRLKRDRPILLLPQYRQKNTTLEYINLLE